MAFTEKQRALLDLATSENEQADFPYRPSDFWRKESRDFEREFSTRGVEHFLDAGYNARFHGIRRNDPRLYDWFLNVFYSLLKLRDTHGLLDLVEDGAGIARHAHQGPSGDPDGGTPIRVEGKWIHADLLFSIHDFYNLCELCPAIASEPVIVGDLGAGWGRLGHVLVQANPRATYLVFDIPGSLVISSTTLPALLPQVAIKTYPESRGSHEFTRDVLSQSRIWLLGSHDLRRMRRGAVDVLINVAGFQEMPALQANAYLQVFDRVIDHGCVYLRNNAFSKFGLAGPGDYRIPARWQARFVRRASFSENIFEAGYTLGEMP